MICSALAAPRTVERALARYCAALADAHANPAARRGYALALGSVPAAAVRHLRAAGTLPAMLAALDTAARCPPRTRTDERDAETRRNAVRAAALVATVAADAATDADELVHTVLAPWVRALLCAAAEDHAGDARGDVGAWVRTEALAGIRSLAARGVITTTDGSADIAAAVCSQLGARLPPLRAAAAATLRALAPCLPPATRAVVASTEPSADDGEADALRLCDALLAGDSSGDAGVRAAVVRGLVAAAGCVPPDAAAAAVLARHRAAALPALRAAVGACADSIAVRRYLAPALLTVLAHTFAAEDGSSHKDDEEATRLLAQDTLAWVRSDPLWRSADYALIDGTLAVLGALARGTDSGTTTASTARVLLAAVRVRHPFPVVRARAATALGLPPPATAEAADDPAVCASVCTALNVTAEQLPPIDIPAAAIAAAPSSSSSSLWV